jgi:hypothetical protein
LIAEAIAAFVAQAHGLCIRMIGARLDLSAEARRDEDYCSTVAALDLRGIRWNQHIVRCSAERANERLLGHVCFLIEA